MADTLSQDEINALLGGGSLTPPGTAENGTLNSVNDSKDLSKEHHDALKQIGIEMMTVSGKTLQDNLHHEVVVENPTVVKGLLSSSKDKFTIPSLGVRIEYKVGVEGSNVLVLNDKDAKIIANLMQGGDGVIDEEDSELNMIDESALCEAMNQMVGSSSTILFKILGEKVDIDTPKIFPLNLDDEVFIKDFGFTEDKECIIMTFPLKVGTLIDSEIIQIMPAYFADKLISSYTNRKPDTPAKVQNEINNFDDNAQLSNENEMQYNNEQMPNNMQQNQMSGGMQNMQNSGYQGNNMQNTNYNNQNAKPAQFQNFDMNEVIQQKENINIIMDVPLEVTVEMGRTVKKIEEILEFSPGTIIELDKLAGDPIDILVNGKFVAKGEVVVIDENYGIRITDIINFKNRI